MPADPRPKRQVVVVVVVMNSTATPLRASPDAPTSPRPVRSPFPPPRRAAPTPEGGRDGRSSPISEGWHRGVPLSNHFL